MCEVENTLNSRPLTPVSSDVDELEASTPNHILRLNNATCFSPGVFDERDCYLRKRWRQVQQYADTFWHRWKRQYVTGLIARQKWFTPQRPHQVGDLVLVVDENLPRNLGCLGRIVEISLSDNGNMHSAFIKVNRHKEGKTLKLSTTILERPINKLVLIMSDDNS